MMPKINREEYEVLKELDDKWKWIARDDSKSLFIFVEKPYKKNGMRYWDVPTYTDEFVDYIKSDLFQFIQWEDSEPYDIAELIEEYEKKDWRQILEKYKDDESEETEVKKDLDWLVQRIQSERGQLTQSFAEDKETDDEGIFNDGRDEALSSVLRLIDQLDEPEVLSSDWIKDNQRMWVSTHGIDYHVPANKLYGKIVQKQEEITESFKETIRELIETSELAMDVRKLTGMTLEEIKEEARNGGFVPKQEVLSQKWINDRKEHWTRLKIDGYSVPEEDLQNLLVPTLSKMETVEITEEPETAYKDILDRGEFWFDGKEYKVVEKGMQRKQILQQVQQMNTLKLTEKTDGGNTGKSYVGKQEVLDILEKLDEYEVEEEPGWIIREKGTNFVLNYLNMKTKDTKGALNISTGWSPADLKGYTFKNEETANAIANLLDHDVKIEELEK